MFVPQKFKKTNFTLQFEHIEGWLSREVAVLLFELSRNLKNDGAIVEIGSWKGRSTACLAQGSLQGQKNPIFAIDPHTGSQEHQQFDDNINTFAEFQENLFELGLSHMVTPIRKTSLEVSAGFHQPVELLWIDGSHEYQDVLGDYQNWFPKVCDGGWILFHDSKWPGVRKVLWEELFTNGHIGPVFRIEDTTFAQKRISPPTGAYQYNQLQLKKEKFLQLIKRKKRAWRKKLKSQSTST